MLGVVLFVLFWVVLAVGLVFIASRGGVSGAREALQSQSRGGRRFMSSIFVITFVGFGVVLPAVFLLGNRDNANGQVGGIRLNANEKAGREVFAQRCGMCHTLAAANTTGKVGPNLDQLRPPASLVLNTINNGCVQNPPPGSSQSCLGYGTMPAGVIEGKQAQQVAAFVAAVAGRE